MFVRAPFATVCFTLFVLATSGAQYMDHSSNMGNNSVIGVLYGPDGVPTSGVRVEARDAATMALIATSYTQSNGSFELYNIPAGNYDISAQGQSVEGHETLAVNSSMSRVEIRLSPRPESYAAGGTVSVAQLKIPQKAIDNYTKAQQAFFKHKFDEAQKQVNKALAAYARYPQALTLHGLLALHNRSIAQGMQDFQQAIQLDPNFGPPYLAMGAVYNSQGKFDDATRTIERGLLVSPNSWQGYFEMAKAYLGKGMYAKALQVANQAQSLGANSFAAIHLVKAYAMVPMKLYKDAALELQAFLSHPQPEGMAQAQRLLAQVEAAEAAAVPAIAPEVAVGATK